MKFQNKIIVIFATVLITLTYSVYEKSKIDALSERANTPILKSLPEFSLKEIYKNKLFTNTSIMANTKALMVHFWGTWCAPCEVELPDFIKLTDRYKNKDIKFLLIAVNDDEKKIKKFMKRFGQLSESVYVLHDADGSIMSKFGTVKVPETYLFDSSSALFNRYIGSQSWGSPYFDHQIIEVFTGKSK